MTTIEPRAKQDSASRLIESIGGLERSSLEVVRKFVDTVDGILPDVRDDGPRRKIIDSAFKMVEQLVGASNDFAQTIVLSTEHASDELDKKASSATA